MTIAPHSGGEAGAREKGGRPSSSCGAEVTFGGSQGCLEDEGKVDGGCNMADAARGSTRLVRRYRQEAIGGGWCR